MNEPTLGSPPTAILLISASLVFLAILNSLSTAPSVLLPFLLLGPWTVLDAASCSPRVANACWNTAEISEDWLRMDKVTVVMKYHVLFGRWGVERRDERRVEERMGWGGIEN